MSTSETLPRLDTGVDWLGHVPSHWNQTTIRAITDTRNEKGKPDLPLLSVYRDFGVIRKDSRDDNHNRDGQDLSTYKVVFPNDLVLNKMKTWQGSLGVSELHGIVSPAYIVCKLDENVNGRFVHYLLRSKPYVFEYNRISYGVRVDQWDMRYDLFKTIPVFLPPRAEQNAIVAFLDRKLAEIDRFIANKRQMVELLERERKAIRRKAVTRGIDNSVNFKSSRVFWLPEIPDCWNSGRIKSEFDNLNTRRIPLNASDRGEMTLRKYDYYGASGVIDKVDDYIFDEPTILVAEDGANLVLRNLRLSIIAEGKYWVNNHAHILRPKRGNIYYLAELLEAIDFNPWITGAAQPKLTKDRLMAVEIPVPPIEIQDQIEAYLKEEYRRIDSAVDAIYRETKLIEEFRTALIAEAVTGKIDVRSS